MDIREFIELWFCSPVTSCRVMTTHALCRHPTTNTRKISSGGTPIPQWDAEFVPVVTMSQPRASRQSGSPPTIRFGLTPRHLQMASRLGAYRPAECSKCCGNVARPPQVPVSERNSTLRKSRSSKALGLRSYSRMQRATDIAAESRTSHLSHRHVSPHASP